MLYTPNLITLDYARQHRGLQTDEDEDDVLLQEFIAEASAEFQRAIDRVCVPYYATHVFDYQAPYTLTFSGYDLLAVTTLTNGDGATVSASNYVLRSANVYPKWRAEIKGNASVTFTWDNTWHEAISVAGWWGYSPNYATGAWKQATTLAEALTSGESDIDLTNAANIGVGDYLKVGDHIMRVTAKAVNTVTVDTAQLGTTAAAHDNGATVYVYQQLPDIKAAVREMVAYAYLHKDRIGSRVTVFDGGSVTVEDLDPRVQKAINDHARKRIVSVR